MCDHTAMERSQTAPLKLSVLDQSPVYPGETAADAFRHTIQLAQCAERWGYNRFWVTEHHGSTGVMGSSPEVLISHLLAKTDRIRVGSGGVMLQHYSPYKVAENFNVLSCLAGGRVDLGIGGGPGGMPNSTRALQQDTGHGAKPFHQKVLELRSFLQDRLEQDHPLFGLQASPVPTQPADLFVLGTTPSSAEMAAGLGLPYVFALFLNNDEDVMTEAVRTYRDKFDPASGSGAQAMLALPVMVAETDEEAQSFASGLKLVRVHMESGRTVTVFTVEAAEEFRHQSGENCDFEVRDLEVIHGSKETVRRELTVIQGNYQVDEVFVVTAIRDFGKRLLSYKLLSEALPQTLTS